MRARPAVAENDACARGSDTSGRPSRWPCPSISTTKRTEEGQGRGGGARGKARRPPPPQPTLFSLYEEEPGGGRPASLVEPLGPQAQVQRHAVEHLADVAPLLQCLDAPVPQEVEQLMDAFKSLDSPMAEQVMAVPKISSPSHASRTVLSEPQTAEQLVEAPTIVSLIEVIRQPVEQTVDIPVRAGGVGSGGLQGFLHGQSFPTVEQTVDFPVPSRLSGVGGLQGLHPGQSLTAFPGGSLHHGDFQGLHPGQSSTAFPVQKSVDVPVLGGSLHFGDSQHSAEKNVDIPVPDGRGTSCNGGLQVSLPGQSSRARARAHVRGGGVQGSVPRQSSPALGRADVRGRFRGGLSVPPGSRSCGFIQTSVGGFLRVPVSWYDYFPTGAAVTYTVRVGPNGVMEADATEM